MDQTIAELNNNWKLAYMDNSEVKNLSFSPATIADIESNVAGIEAHVPGDFLLELNKKGILKDPYFGCNSWDYQKYEYTHVWYYTTFDYNGTVSDRLYFDFEGLDTIAEIYLNGILIGKTDNMFIAHNIPASSVVSGKNELIVHFIPVLLHAREKRLPLHCHTLFYSFEALTTRKPMHSYGWDIMPRILSCGLFRPVFLKEKKKDSIDELHLFTLRVDPEKNFARVRIYFALSLSRDNPREYRIEISGKCKDSTFHEECCPHHTEYSRLAFGLENCYLWWPKNQGKQNLYEVEARLYHGEELVDTKKMKIGIRTAELRRTDAVTENGGDFRFLINNRPVFCLGTNWVPMSPFHCEDEKRLPKALELLDDSGCNMVRVWGGSLYPSDDFYDFCDEKGILVWQDFAMACASYPQDEEFAKQIEEESTAVVKRLRHHPSLVLWAGDNECDAVMDGWNGCRRDPNENILTRKILPDVIRNHDFTRAYLPSSPYISKEAFEKNLPTPEMHLWDPNRIYFKTPYYMDSPCSFASEIGYHGCPSVESLRRFIGKDYLWPINAEEGKPNRHWLAHSTESQEDGELSFVYRSQLHQKEVIHLFGSLPDTLEEYSLMSQVSQAEAYKFFIESFRARKWSKTGILWWNLLDGWPQISDAVVDFYYDKKLAYHFIKKSQNPICLFFDEPRDGKMMLVCANDTDLTTDVSYTVRSVTRGEELLCGIFHSEANENVPFTSISATDDSYEMFLIEYEADGKKYTNHYCKGLVGMDIDRYLADLSETILPS